ncbi:transglycosylase SLT domain-containing protein [Dongia rigui]|uniref:Transglycosylase SLT domain-containing protein n=1 Tax=Dongia rigui TaxID=940149 RepID=A0ABU5DTC2_9PROT|nr:transglycosylase SLT domain-containing protein [Dongia rigui]MDY0870292.1 transglycosylase SLT domain-containing protein [Dongia rigui]
MTPMATLVNVTGQDVSIRSDVLAGIREASASTGVDFAYLMAQANRESSFDPSAQAKSSSAAGLYQFVEQTWLGVVKNHGAEYGQGDLAQKITRRSDGHFVVADAAARKEILELRRDPSFASAMAAEHAADNQAKLEEKLGRDVNGTDLYMAHFLGISGALKFLRTMEDSPERTGASLFPKAAAANRNVFYTEDGRARTVSEIYNRFDTSMDADMAAYAALDEHGSEVAVADAGSGDTVVGSIPGTSLVAGLSLPAAPNAAFFGGLRTTRSPDSRPDGTAMADAGSSSLSRVGSLLSPLMLVTLAALPVSGEDDGSRNDPADREAPAANAAGGSLFNSLDDPLHLDLLRTASAI